MLPEVGTLYRVALAITRARYEAEDLVQDSLIRAYRGIGGFDGSRLRAWLLTILRNTHVKRHRRQRPGLLRDPAAHEHLAGDAGVPGGHPPGFVQARVVPRAGSYPGLEVELGDAGDQMWSSTYTSSGRGRPGGPPALTRPVGAALR